MAERLPAELNGNPIIGQVLDITDPNDLAFGFPPTPRTCSFCFFRQNEEDCQVKNGAPKKAFGIKSTEIMPQQIDDIEVGFYCSSWAHYDCE